MKSNQINRRNDSNRIGRNASYRTRQRKREVVNGIKMEWNKNGMEQIESERNGINTRKGNTTQRGGRSKRNKIELNGIEQKGDLKNERRN
jgi:hypothetical protein